jgi:hypothetical protein
MYPCMYVGSRGENLSSDCTLGLSGGGVVFVSWLILVSTLAKLAVFRV